MAFIGTLNNIIIFKIRFRSFLLFLLILLYGLKINNVVNFILINSLFTLNIKAFLDFFFIFLGIFALETFG